MSKIKYNCGYCSSCGKSVRASVDQTIIEGCLKWYVSYQCQSCGAVVEADDIGLPPEEIREFLIQNQGRWELRLDGREANRVIVARVLRKALVLSLTEVTNLTKSIPGTLYLGTQVEVEWLAQVLASQGIAARVVCDIPGLGIPPKENTKRNSTAKRL